MSPDLIFMGGEYASKNDAKDHSVFANPLGKAKVNGRFSDKFRV